MINIFDETNVELVLTERVSENADYLEFLEVKNGNFCYKKLKKIIFSFSTNTQKYLENNYSFCIQPNDIQIVLEPINMNMKLFIGNTVYASVYPSFGEFIKYCEENLSVKKVDRIKKAIQSYICDFLNVPDSIYVIKLWDTLDELRNHEELLYKVVIENLHKKTLSVQELENFTLEEFMSGISTYYLIEQVEDMKTELMKERLKLIELNLKSKRNFYSYFIGILIVSVPLFPIIYDISSENDNLGGFFVLSSVFVISLVITSIILKILIIEKELLLPLAKEFKIKNDKYKLVEDIELKNYEYDTYIKYFNISKCVLVFSVILFIFIVI